MVDVRAVQSKLRTRLLVSACCAAAALSGGAACAADVAPAKPGANVDEVVVTARRVAEDVQKVPLTDNVLTAESLTNQGVQNLDQIGNLAPNVVWSDAGTTAFQKITIRGIPSNDSLVAFDPGVGVYVDDVYQASSLSFNSSLLDIASVQILKGPQGTLFGRNTDAGAIVITTEKPSTDSFYVKADTDVGNYQFWRGRAVINMPLSDDLALKISGVYSTREGFDRNLITNARDVNNEHHYGGMAQLLYAPTDALKILGELYYYKDTGAQNNPSCFGPGVEVPGNFCPANPTEAATLSRNLYSYAPIESQRTMWGGSLHVDWKTPGDVLLTSVTAYSHLVDIENQDQDYVNTDFIRSGFTAPGQWQFSQEVRVTSPQDQRLRGTGGVFYSHDYSPVNSPITFESAILQGLGVTGFTSLSTSTPAVITTDSYAVFGQGQFSVTPQLIAELGLRYTADSKSMRYEEDVPAALQIFAGPSDPGVPVEVPAFEASHSWGALSGTASLSYQFTDDVMAYARYSRGYKSGGFNANTSTNFNTAANPNAVVLAQEKPFNPEYLDSYEVGVKVQAFDHRLTFNAAAFSINYTDLQVQVTDITLSKFISNAPSAKSTGVEAEIVWKPIDGLVLSANGGLEDAKYQSFSTTFAGLGNLSGKRLTYSPPSSGAVNATYTFPLTHSWHGLVSLTGLYNGGMYLQPSNAAIAVEKAYEELNARLGVESDDGKYGVYLWSNNMTNVARITSETSAIFAGGIVTLNAPQTFGIELKGRF